jgi:hypothetical protein
LGKKLFSKIFNNSQNHIINVKGENTTSLEAASIHPLLAHRAQALVTMVPVEVLVHPRQHFRT